MGFVEIKESLDWLPSIRRVLIQGPPNSRKTSSAKTFADTYAPLALLSYPGEQGANSIPRTESIKPFIWRDTPEEKLDSAGKFRAVEKLTRELISGKHGKFNCFFGDGLHNLAYLALDAAAGGTFFQGKDFEINRAFGVLDAYSKAYNMMVSYINMVNDSPVPMVVFTAWDGRESEKEETGKNESRVYPEMPGRLAKKVMGMFPLILFSHIKPPANPTQKPKGMWQLKQDTKIAGAACKVPIEIQEKLPTAVEQDWGALEVLLTGLAKEAA